VVAISPGVAHCLALRENGTVVPWGTPHVIDLALRLEPPRGLKNVVALAAAFDYALALNADGGIMAWGDPSYNAEHYQQGVTNVPRSLTGVVAIAACVDHNLGLVSDANWESPVRITSSRRDTNGFTVSIPTRSGKVYRLEYRESLTEGVWRPSPLVAGNGGVRSLTDPNGGEIQRFYRVRRW
jgi:hypothetical protein